MDKTLVIGSTGNLGREVVDGLVAAGAAPRALSRRQGVPDEGAERVPGGVEGVVGDLRDPAMLEAALTGVRSVFLVWPFLTTEHAPAVLDAIGRHARRVVYVSSSGVDRTAGRQTDPIRQLHADMEELIEKSEVEWTVLRADTFASNARGWAAQIRAGDVVRGPDSAATAVIDERDIAAVAVRALTEDGHGGATYVLTGPHVLSRTEQVRAIGDAVGRPLRFEAVPPDVARERMLADGRPPALVDALLAGAEARQASELITTTVEDITGAPARTFARWAADRVDVFR
ncbi:nucleotide-diphosphate-sugar epimerase [Streptomyces parvus]|uniref:NAD(P)H-binding protein n=1 Tax=Streptomyces parvus TaxID=66428 RepID=UPI001679142D|nr:NAD(P)H-binding protein [Streptomyces parvus]GGS36197.1 nucleotide-diphosphate-sugar epimerase [Streptomyces parvus]